MKQLIKNKLGNQWRTVVLDGNSSTVNLNVRKQLKKYSRQAVASTNSQSLVIVLYFESGNILIPQCTRKRRKKRNVNQHNEIYDETARNPAPLPNSPSIETSVAHINALNINEATSPRNDSPPPLANKLPNKNMLRVTTADLPNQSLLEIDFDLKNTKLVLPDNKLQDESIVPVVNDCSNKNSSQLDDKLPRNSLLQFNNKSPNHILLPLDENLEEENVFSYGDHFPNDDLLSLDDHIEKKSVYSRANDLANDNLMSANGHLEKENVFLRNDNLPNDNLMLIDDELSNTKLVPRTNDLLNPNTVAVTGQYLNDNESSNSDNVREIVHNNMDPDLPKFILDLYEEKDNTMKEYNVKIDETHHRLDLIQVQLNEAKNTLNEAKNTLENEKVEETVSLELK
ncbi:unnamed protein product [Rotaria sordida]|uniref:Uncharacterized protein n=1 Tax=Rotaria sordida TaxID=392033 RepID=A0A819AB29_9BILA|nr:unnamed protein product [Rotaria sordida]CAF1197782.1 unnamed protein product [Rotaria sordida]CAF1213965.1 unnamed protein product [Rotaria sordida]CAF1468044.1 unnamed protein product [Rotaria sordida]CAF3775305.1 unnamed protein product [Rotaria sordida]